MVCEQESIRNLFLKEIAAVVSEFLDLYKRNIERISDRFTMDLSRIFIDYLHLHESVAKEIASILVTGRQKISVNAMQQSTDSQLANHDENDTNSCINTHIHSFGKENVPLIMSKMTKYLMEVDWRIFFYLTEQFMQKGSFYSI